MYSFKKKKAVFIFLLCFPQVNLLIKPALSSLQFPISRAGPIILLLLISSALVTFLEQGWLLLGKVLARLLWCWPDLKALLWGAAQGQKK